MATFKRHHLRRNPLSTSASAHLTDFSGQPPHCANSDACQGPAPVGMYGPYTAFTAAKLKGTCLPVQLRVQALVASRASEKLSKTEALSCIEQGCFLITVVPLSFTGPREIPVLSNPIRPAVLQLSQELVRQERRKGFPTTVKGYGPRGPGRPELFSVSLLKSTNLILRRHERRVRELARLTRHFGERIGYVVVRPDDVARGELLVAISKIIQLTKATTELKMKNPEAFARQVMNLLRDEILTSG